MADTGTDRQGRAETNDGGTAISPSVFILGFVLLLISAALISYCLGEASIFSRDYVAIIVVLGWAYAIHGFSLSFLILFVSALLVAAAPDWLVIRFVSYWHEGDWLALPALMKHLPSPIRAINYIVILLTFVLIPARLLIVGKLRNIGQLLLYVFLIMSTSLAIGHAAALFLIASTFSWFEIIINSLIVLIFISGIYVFYQLIYELDPDTTNVFESTRVMSVTSVPLNSYLANRYNIIGVISILYVYVIITFAGLYYYIDHCSGDFCNIISSQLLTPADPAHPRKDSGNFNFDPKNLDGDTPGHGDQAALGFTARRFLPYLYFSVVTSTTVGYGDITPVTITAVGIVILHHLVTIVLLVGIVGQIAGMSSR